MKNIVIIGSSEGIGYGLVNKFLDNGYHVFAISRNIRPLSMLKSKQTNLTVIQADITDLTHQSRILSNLSQVVSVEIINNAAIGTPTNFQELDIEELRSHFETNFFAPVVLLKKILAQNKVNRVLNISSGAAEFPLPSLLAYCSSKAAIHHAMKCLNLEYHDTKFSNLRPGMVDTPLQERWRAVNDSVFPNGNFYKQAKAENKLISVSTVSDFVFWVFNLALDEFVKPDWNINTEEHHKYWLNKTTIFSK
jgi:benzil reductase ((S)-benzoin forming)